MEITQVLLKPLLSEKTNLQKEDGNKVSFKVHQDSTKYDVKAAVETIFNVKVENVNMVRYRPRARRKFGRQVGRISGQKKAYVTLAAGESIDFFEGV